MSDAWKKRLKMLRRRAIVMLVALMSWMVLFEWAARSVLRHRTRTNQHEWSSS